MCAADGDEEVIHRERQARHLILRSARSARLEGWTKTRGHPSRRGQEAAPQDEVYYFSGSLGGTGEALLPAVAPPSIGSVMPVTQRNSSLARYSAP